MAVLRLFAQAREAAGVASATIDAPDVDALLAMAVQRFGPGFDTVLRASRVWLNGDPVEGAAALSAADEVAVLPPVSGGA